MKIRSMTALFASVLLAAFVVACGTGGGGAAAAPGGASGTATGVAQGFGGEISVTVTMVDGAITAVEMDLSPETPSFAAPVESRAAGEMVRFNTANIDNVAGSTVTTSAVRAAAQSAVDQINAAAAQAPAPVVEETDYVETAE